MMKTLSVPFVRVSSVIVILLFLLSPILSFPLILLEIYNKRKYAIILFILFFSLVAYLFPPSGDLYRYYSLYYINFVGISYLDIFDFYVFDLLWYSILYILANLDLSFQVSTFISIYIQFYIVYYYLKKFQIIEMPISLRRLFLIVSSFLYLGFWINIELRFMLALSLFLVEVYALINHNKKGVIAFFILSSLCHLSFLFFSFLLFIGYVFRKCMNIYTAFAIAIMGNVVVISIGTFLDTLGFAKAGYITEQSNWAEDLSPLLLFFRIVLRGLPYFILAFFVLFSRSLSEYRKLSLFFLSLSIATLIFPDLNERIRIISTSISWLFFISSINSVSKWAQYLFIGASLVAFFAGSVIANRSLYIGRYDKLFVPYVITICDGGYSDHWIEHRIDNGDVVNITE